MNDDSYNISISFKTNLAQLQMMENACQNNYMTRSDLIRSGILLMMSKLAKNKLGDTTSGNTNNTYKMDVASVFDDIPPSVDMFGSTSQTVVDTASVDDESPCSPSLYGWD